MSVSQATADLGRQCATCVFWAPRGGREEQSMGRCRALFTGSGDLGQNCMTRAYFACDQWCGRTGAATSAAE